MRVEERKGTLQLNWGREEERGGNATKLAEKTGGTERKGKSMRELVAETRYAVEE